MYASPPPPHIHTFTTYTKPSAPIHPPPTHLLCACCELVAHDCVCLHPVDKHRHWQQALCLHLAVSGEEVKKGTTTQGKPKRVFEGQGRGSKTGGRIPRQHTPSISLFPIPPSLHHSFYKPTSHSSLISPDQLHDVGLVGYHVLAVQQQTNNGRICATQGALL